MRLGLWVLTFGLLAGILPAQDPHATHCRAFNKCHAKHGLKRKSCPVCGDRSVFDEDACCSRCASKAEVCRHCGLPKEGAKPSPLAKKFFGSRYSDKPIPFEKEVEIPIGDKVWGTLNARLFAERLEVAREEMPVNLPETRPFLVVIKKVTPDFVKRLLDKLEKDLGKDFPSLVFEIFDNADSDFSYYKSVAKVIKEKNEKLLVGGPGERPLYDRGAFQRFNATAKADFISGNYPGGVKCVHHNYVDGDFRMFGASKLNFDTIFDISAEIAGKINYPPNTKMALTAYGYKGHMPGASVEEKVFAATVVTNFAVVNVQRIKSKEGRPIVLHPVDPSYFEALRAGNEVLWPAAFGGNGDPYDNPFVKEYNYMPITGVVTREPGGGTVHAVFVNNSPKSVKAKTTIPGKGEIDFYFTPYEVKIRKF